MIEQDLDFRKKQRPIHTYILMIVLCCVFAFQVLVLGDDVYNFMTHTSDIFSGTYYTLFTSLFLHAGIFHLVSNLIGLFLFGRLVEKHFNSKIYLVFILGGIFANIVSNALAHSFGEVFYSLGASSGIASIIIFGILLEPLRLTTILGWFLIAFDLYGIANPQGSTNHLAHLGGYLALVLLYFLIEKSHKKRVLKGLFVNIVLLIMVYFTLLTLGFLEMIF